MEHEFTWEVGLAFLAIIALMVLTIAGLWCILNKEVDEIDKDDDQ